jgi:hypothetical protein
MTKYTKYMRKPKAKRQVPPLWRGIGCIMMIVVPIISYGLGYIFLQEAKHRNWVPVELLGYWKFPEWAYTTPILATPVRFLGSLKDVLAMVIFFVATLIVVSGLVGFIYTAIYQVVGPARYSELDAEPTKRKTREYRR